MNSMVYQLAYLSSLLYIVKLLEKKSFCNQKIVKIFALLFVFPKNLEKQRKKKKNSKKGFSIIIG